MQETPSISHALLSLASHTVAGILAALGTLWFKRKREPAEVAKIAAETRSIDTASDLSIVQEMRELLKDVASSTARAERVREERDHWQRKAEAYERTLAENANRISVLEQDAIITDREMQDLKAMLRLNP